MMLGRKNGDEDGDVTVKVPCVSMLNAALQCQPSIRFPTKSADTYCRIQNWKCLFILYGGLLLTVFLPDGVSCTVVLFRYFCDLVPTDIYWVVSDLGWAKSAYALFTAWNNGACLFVDYTSKFDPERTLKVLCWKLIVLYTEDCNCNLWPSLWPSGIGSRLGRNRLWARFLAVSDIYSMFIEPTITWVPSGFSGYIWLDTKIVLKKKNPTFFHVQRIKAF